MNPFLHPAALAVTLALAFLGLPLLVAALILSR